MNRRLLASLADVVLALRSALGYLTAGLLRAYTGSTLHGDATIARIALVTILVGLAHTPRTRSLTALWLACTLGLISTFSILSHNAAMGGWVPAASDVVHLAAAAAWMSAASSSRSCPAHERGHRTKPRPSWPVYPPSGWPPW